MDIESSIKRVAVESPVEKTYYWDGKRGKFFTYNEGVKEDYPDEPFSFIPLEDRVTLSGYDTGKEASLFSEEVASKDFRQHVFNVRCAEGKDDERKLYDYAEGTYESLKKDTKIKYTLVIYALDSNTLELIKIPLKGAALSGFNSSDTFKFNKMFTLTGTLQKKKGGVDYVEPVFEYRKLDEEEFKESLQIYRDKLKPYFVAKDSGTGTGTGDDNDDVVVAVEDGDVLV